MYLILNLETKTAPKFRNPHIRCFFSKALGLERKNKTTDADDK